MTTSGLDVRNYMKIIVFPSVRDKNQDHSHFIGLSYGTQSTMITFVFN
jgi:hypothetical protein